MSTITCIFCLGELPRFGDQKTTEAKYSDHLLSWHNIVVEDQRRRVLDLVMREDVGQPIVAVQEAGSSKSGIIEIQTNKSRDLPNLTANFVTQLSRQNLMAVTDNEDEEIVAEVGEDTTFTSEPNVENQTSVDKEMVSGEDNIKDEVREMNNEVNFGEVVCKVNVAEEEHDVVGAVSTDVIHNTDVKHVTTPHLIMSSQVGEQLIQDVEDFDPMLIAEPQENNVSNESTSSGSRGAKTKLVVSNKLFGKRKRCPETPQVRSNMFVDARLDNVWHTCEECGEVVARGNFYSSHIKRHNMNKKSYVAKYPHKKRETADWTCRICSKRLVWTSRHILPHLATVHMMTKEAYFQLFLVSEEEEVGPVVQ